MSSKAPNYRPPHHEAFTPSEMELEILRTLRILYAEKNYEPVGRREFDLLYGQRDFMERNTIDIRGYMAFHARTDNSFELLLYMHYIEQTRTFLGKPTGLFKLTGKGYILVEAYDPPRLNPPLASPAPLPARS